MSYDSKPGLDDPVDILRGIGEERSYSIGCRTVRDVCRMKLDDDSPKWLRIAKLHAESIRRENPILIHDTPEIAPAAEIDIFFDFETLGSHYNAYMVGALTVDNTTGKRDYLPLFADRNDGGVDEKSMTAKFAEFVDRFDVDKAAFIHWTKFEPTVVHRILPGFQHKMIDMYQVMSNSLVLPTRNMSLKTVAKYVGFKGWLDDVDWAVCAGLFMEYNYTGDAKCLLPIKKYNMDDCVSLYEVTKWYRKWCKVISA